MSRSWVEIDTSAIRENAAAILDFVDGPALCAVVKADGYGHGAVPVANAALAGGARYLGVAQVDEGVRLREAGIDAPIWVLSEPEPRELETAATYDLQPVLYSEVGVKTASLVSETRQLDVHLKVDTGMHRVGARPQDALVRAREIAAAPGLMLKSVFTHCAVADEPDNPFTNQQMDRFDDVLAELRSNGIHPPFVHAANSGGAIAFPRTRLDVVRCGISLYGLSPSPSLTGLLDVRPALRWVTSVGFVKRLRAGDEVGYGLRTKLERDTTVVTLPVGYADGYNRATWKVPGAVVVGGKRRNLVGVVSMDQIVVDVGDDMVLPGDEAVLVGRQGDAEISAEDLASGLGTINYEITCGLSSRVERVHLNRLEAAGESE